MSKTLKEKKPKFLGGSILSPANFTANPSAFSSPYAKVGGVGCAGTLCNTKAADGQYVSYSQNGGSSVVCQADSPIIKDHVIGPKAGHSSVTGCPKSLVRSDLSAPLLEPLSLKKGGKKRKRRVTRKRKTKGKKRRARRTRKGPKRKRSPRRSRRMRKTRRGSKKFRRGSKSKTHKGKDFETRKGSKRYHEKKWEKFLRGRKTLPAPDFPFVGGSASNPCSNTPISFGYSTGGPSIGADNSALASPPPQQVYDHCMKNNFPPRT